MTQTIGFIGAGVMGQGMIRNLMKQGFRVNLNTRTKVKATQLITEGAHWYDSKSLLVSESDVIITMIGTPEDVSKTYLGKEGIIEHAHPDTLLIDMTSSSPKLAGDIYEQAKKRQLLSLDAPVSGGDIGARDGNLAIMVGGDEVAFNQALPIFKAMGENIQYQGPAGSGQHTKLINQMTIAPAMLGIAEALIYAEKSGGKIETILKSISTGAAGSWSLTNYAPRIIKGDFAPGFAIKHFIKDMNIAIDSAKELGMNPVSLILARDMYESISQTESESGIHAIIKAYE